MSKKEKDICEILPLGKLCAMITKPYFGALTLKMEHLGIEKHFSVLILLDQKSPCTQQHISDSLQIDKVSMVKVIDGFAKKGLVKRVQNPKDRREHFIELTPKAHKILPQIYKAVEDLNQMAFENFKPKEQKDFYKALTKVYRNIEHLPTSHVIVNYKKTKIKK